MRHFPIFGLALLLLAVSADALPPCALLRLHHLPAAESTEQRERERGYERLREISYKPLASVAEAERLAQALGVHARDAFAGWKEPDQLVVYHAIFEALSRIPPDLLDFLLKNGARLDLIAGNAVIGHPELKHLTNVQPRGYPKGETFRQVEACAGDRCAYLAVDELFEDRMELIYTVLHEYGHVIEQVMQKLTGEELSKSPAFVKAIENSRWGSPYLDDHPDEAFAEGFARALSTRHGFAPAGVRQFWQDFLRKPPAVGLPMAKDHSPD